jgi:hypothetical protein
MLKYTHYTLYRMHRHTLVYKVRTSVQYIEAYTDGSTNSGTLNPEVQLILLNSATGSSDTKGVQGSVAPH